MTATVKRLDWDNGRHRARCLAGFPASFESALKSAIETADRKEGYGAGNLIALSIHDLAQGLPLTLDASDDDICQRAARMAHQARRYPTGAADRAARDGIEPPEGTAGLLRMQDDLWERRRYRVRMGRAVEATAREIGLVSQRTGAYCSNETLERRAEQKARLARIMESLEAVSDAGDVLSMEAIAAASVSNPKIRRGELMTRIAGMEKYAQEHGDMALFLTLTCPSRFHANSPSGARNPRYDGSTPRQAQAYLQQVWARIRAQVARQQIDIYGLRIAEPHHDGTPHWHYLIFVSPAAKNAYTQIFREHALRDSPEEPGAQTYRVDIKEIDPAKGSAIGYVAKYVAKAVDGYGIDRDLLGVPSQDAAARVEAWARVWGIRQFQFVGGPKVGVWRELRRADGAPAGPIGTAWAAADNGDWHAFMMAQEVAPVALARAWSDKSNRYGEPCGWRVVGVEAGSVTVPTRKKQWSIRRAARGEFLPSWSPVNNCTEGVSDGNGNGATGAGDNAVVGRVLVGCSAMVWAVGGEKMERAGQIDPHGRVERMGVNGVPHRAEGVGCNVGC